MATPVTYPLGKLSAAAMLAAFFLLWLVSLPVVATDTLPARVVANLRAWDGVGSKILDTPWQVIRGKIVRPVDFDSMYQGDTVVFPDKWHEKENKLAQQNKWPHGFGIATYRTRILLPETSEPLSIRLNSIFTALEFWVDGKLVATNGKVTETPEGAEAFYMQRTIPLPRKHQVDIVLIVSNFDHNAGGVIRPPTIARTAAFDVSTKKLMAAYFFILGGLIALFLFKFTYFLHSLADKVEWPLFWYCLLVVVFLARLATLNSITYTLLPNLPQFNDRVLDYLVLYSSSALYITLLSSIFPNEFSKAVKNTVYAVTVLFLSYVVFLPTSDFTSKVDYFTAFALLVLIYNQTAVYRAWRNGRAGAGVTLIVTTLYLIATTNDSMRYLHVIDLRQYSTTDLMPLAFLILSIGHAVTLSARSRAIYVKAQLLSENLQDLNKSLDERVKNRTAEANAAKQQAQKSATEKTNFISAASHDLRQPIHALSIFNETLKNASSQNKELSTIAEKQHLLISSLTEMLDTMLEASRLEAKTLYVNMRTVSLRDIMQNLADTLQPIAAQTNVTLTIIPSSAYIYTDPKYLRRVLSNLILNAIKASPNGRVLVGCRHHKSAVDTQVLDTGYGIPVAAQENIFERYTQLESKNSSAHHGLGLGLSIVKELCALMKMDISLQSDIGQGTNFSITAARVEIEDRAGSGPDTLADEQHKRRLVILVVDDVEEACDALVTLFRNWGHSARGVSSRFEAIETLIDLGRPDLIVADYRLDSETTGLDVIADIHQQYSGVPAVIVTGATAPADLQALVKVPFQVFHKPLDAKLMQQFIAQQFEIKVS